MKSDEPLAFALNDGKQQSNDLVEVFFFFFFLLLPSLAEQNELIIGLGVGSGLLVID
jgi:hypothetical protein